MDLRVLQWAMWVLLATILVGDRIYPAIGMDVPGLFYTAGGNQFMYCAMVFFFCNTISQNLMNTGAFEISYNGTSSFG